MRYRILTSLVFGTWLQTPQKEYLLIPPKTAVSSCSSLLKRLPAKRPSGEERGKRLFSQANLLGISFIHDIGPTRVPAIPLTQI